MLAELMMVGIRMVNYLIVVHVNLLYRIVGNAIVGIRMVRSMMMLGVMPSIMMLVVIPRMRLFPRAQSHLLVYLLVRRYGADPLA